ncbi:hypothetical protein [Haloarcula marina]|uniref:hypothetical protein n=1 Tax=Haloarcula marina TaxID=2961574 RepID=UPI0020B6B863|nr:hypothetical protein [Halomicroarcula marina]
MPFSSDYTPIWESDSTPGEDFEQSVTFEATDADSDESVPGSNSQTNGPLTATVERSGWSQDDVMMAAQLINILLFLALVYEAFSDGDSR